MESRLRDGRPFFYFFDRVHALGEQLLLALVSLAIAGSVKLAMPEWRPATIGLVAVAAMPCSTYALIAGQAIRGRLQAQRWRADALRTWHQVEESWHYLVRILVAWTAAQFVAPWTGPGEEVAAILLPVTIYVLQARPYHDMHVIMHARGQVLAPGDAHFASRERGDGKPGGASPRSIGGQGARP